MLDGRKLSSFFAMSIGVPVVLGDEVDDPGIGHVRVGAAERLGGHHLAGHLLDDVGAGDEHPGRTGLDDEVGEGGE